MHTEEFVLIPKQMYTREQPYIYIYISQLLSNKDVHNPAKQLSLLQKKQVTISSLCLAIGYRATN